MSTKSITADKKLNNSTKNKSNSSNNSNNSTPPTSTSTLPPSTTTTITPPTITPTTKDLSTLLNLPISVTLVPEHGSVLPRTIEGILYTYDPTTSILVLLIPSTSPLTLPSTPSTSQNPPTIKRSYHLIKSAQISSVEILSLIPDNSLPSPLEVLKSVNLKELESKVEKAVRDDQKERARIGEGVSVEGQTLFDALSRTLPVRWSGKSMIVMDEVIINEPYSIKDVKGSKGERVERVIKVLEGERRRLSVV